MAENALVRNLGKRLIRLARSSRGQGASSSAPALRIPRPGRPAEWWCKERGDCASQPSARRRLCVPIFGGYDSELFGLELPPARWTRCEDAITEYETVVLEGWNRMEWYDVHAGEGVVDACRSTGASATGLCARRDIIGLDVWSGARLWLEEARAEAPVRRRALWIVSVALPIVAAALMPLGAVAVFAVELSIASYLRTTPATPLWRVRSVPVASVLAILLPAVLRKSQNYWTEQWYPLTFDSVINAIGSVTLQGGEISDDSAVIFVGFVLAVLVVLGLVVTRHDFWVGWAPVWLTCFHLSCSH